MEEFNPCACTFDPLFEKLIQRFTTRSGKYSTTLNYKGNDLNVSYDYEAGVPATREHPEYEPYICVVSIHIGEYNVTELLEKEFENIESLILNQ